METDPGWAEGQRADAESECRRGPRAEEEEPHYLRSRSRGIEGKIERQ